jgi:hypothetical protein
MQPEPERVAALPFRTQDELLEELEELISSLPAGERQPGVNLGTLRCTDEVKQATAMAQQYASGGDAAFLGEMASGRCAVQAVWRNVARPWGIQVPLEPLGLSLMGHLMR